MSELNRMTEFARPQSVRIAWDHEQRHLFVLVPDLRNNAIFCENFLNIVVQQLELFCPGSADG
ncbi:hypothetical protein C5615_38090, partial [Burkholderia cepacia]